MHFEATEGLSPYIEWLHQTLRHRRVRTLLHPSDVSALQDKLADAKAWLDQLHLRGRISPAKLGQMRQISRQIREHLLALVPPDHPLYPSLFTARQLVEALGRRLEKERNAGARV